ncbi:glycerol acyltransferase [Leyella stercorea]|uniref:glycerol acyltransferase n=1 Tax=Leyella stercorea TaxID=363265 RepID=UPI00242E93BE|nr:glycerol acyltransferase [Leyella stercorea]
MNEITEKTIDIEKILHSKLGSKARYVPHLLVKWLKKIIHQDQVNAFIWEHCDESGVEWLESTVRYLKMDIRIIGKENLPPKDDGKLYTFVSNHPLGGQDGVALGSIIGRHYDGRFRYLVNDLLMNLPGLAPVCIGINKTGRQGRDFPRMVEAGFKSDNHMLMFPAGLNSRKQKDGLIHDLPWKKTFITKSVECHRDVVPIYFSGRNSERFYRIAKFSDRWLPFNLAMIFLVDEMYRNVGKHFDIYIGKPIPWQTFDKSRTPQEWAQWVQQEAYKLPLEK